MEEPTNIQSHLNPVDTCGTQHSAAEYLLFLSAYSIFPKIDHILNYKTCFMPVPESLSSKSPATEENNNINV